MKLEVYDNGYLLQFGPTIHVEGKAVERKPEG
jgi:hypothetical protein